MRRRLWIWIGVLSAVASPLAAQQDTGGADTVSLSLPEALRRAGEESEEVKLAEANVELARTEIAAARAAALPQLNANLGYVRTLASVFDTGGGFSLPDSLRFDPDPGLPLEERVRYLEDKTPAAAIGALGGLFSNLPFGRENAYMASISGSQLLYSGGRVGAALDIAESYRAAAQAGLAQQAAEVRLQVRGAYYQALLAQEIADIAGAALEQADRFLSQEQLRRRAGSASELEVMRAEVARDNLRPQLVQARNAADLAMLNLKRLVDLPLTQPVRLTTELEVPRLSDTAAVRPSPELIEAHAATLAAAQEQVAIRDKAVDIARGASLPNVSMQTNYARQLFPSQMFAFTESWRPDWTVSLNVSVPIFSGFRRRAELQRSQVQLEQSRLQLEQLREGLQLQYEQARGEKERALSAIQARQRTVDVAQRVYDLTVLRYERGLATQLEVSDARLSLLQARTNLAQASADYYIADTGQARASAGAMPPTQSPTAPGGAAR